MAAIAVLLLLHVPPAVVLVNAVVVPVHTVAEPPIAAGAELTVIAFIALQPAPVE
jgi:hypothetical protein